MGAMAQEYPLSISLAKAINAGVDILIVANNDKDYTDEVVSTIATLVKEGKVNASRIHQAYARIQSLKLSKMAN